MDKKNRRDPYFKNLDTLEKKINYKFNNIKYLKIALCHTSYINENRNIKLPSNERQEFLGDAVLSLVVSEYLFNNYSHLPEGKLTKLRSSLVCEKTLGLFASEISLGDFLLLGKGEDNSNGRARNSTLSDSFESLIAAIYLDSGYDLAKQFILKFIIKYLNKDIKLFVDYKTILQEIVQQNPEEKLSYQVAGIFGPDHDKYFLVELMLNSNIVSTGKARSKKDAEQMAAKEALALMGIK